ncbi:MAG: tetratricopeptide repeat protein [Selenomonadaceae bacterium]|nr:tetratricopeptide repeat protein [Selenomonadaceae bacterium]
MAIPDEIKEMRDKAWDAHKRGDNLDAIKLYNELLKIDPNPGLVYSYRSAAYISLGEYEQAIADANEAIKRYPYYYAYNNRGAAYIGLENYEQAIKDCSDSIKRMGNRKYPLAYLNCGIAHYHLKNYEKAISALNKAIEFITKPRQSYFKENLGDTLYYRGLAYEALGEMVKSQADFVKAKQLGYNK